MCDNQTVVRIADGESGGIGTVSTVAHADVDGAGLRRVEHLLVVVVVVYLLTAVQENAFLHDGSEVDGFVAVQPSFVAQGQHRAAVGHIDGAAVGEQTVAGAQDGTAPGILAQRHLEHRGYHLDRGHLQGADAVHPLLVSVAGEAEVGLRQLVALPLKQLRQTAVVVELAHLGVFDVFGVDGHQPQVGGFDVGLVLLAVGQGELKGLVALVQTVQTGALGFGGYLEQQVAQQLVGLAYKAFVGREGGRGVVERGAPGLAQRGAFLEAGEQQGKQQHKQRHAAHQEGADGYLPVFVKMGVYLGLWHGVDVFNRLC